MDKRGLWTILAIFGGLFLVLFGFAVVTLSSVEGGLGVGDNRVGVIEVVGPITESKPTVKNLRKFVRDDSIKALVVRVDSPGGAVAPSQEIYDAVKDAKDSKPLVVSMGSTAASGGYYIACGADTIWANPGTVTGSIGVITQLFNVEELLEQAPIKVHTIKSGPYKDSGSPFREFTERDERYFRAMIDDIYEQFVEDVAECRELELGEVRELADGRVYTGRQAKEYGLVDELGSFQDAVDAVAKEADLEIDEVELVYPPKRRGVFADVLAEGVDGVFDTVRARTSPVVEYRFTGF